MIPVAAAAAGNIGGSVAGGAAAAGGAAGGAAAGGAMSAGASFGMDMLKQGANQNASGQTQQQTGAGQLQNLQSAVAGMMADRGFYKHMTVEKAKKGKKVCIIGRGC